MTKHKPAPRWVEFDFLGFQVETQHPEKYRLKLDANLIQSWHVTRVDDEPDTSVCVVFVGTDTKELGCVMVDLIDYGLCFAPTINDLIYEARHPWLDLKDAHRKKLFDRSCSNEEDTDEDAINFLVLAQGKEKRIQYHIHNEWFLSCQLKRHPSYLAFKPINPAEYHWFKHVEAWKG